MSVFCLFEIPLLYCIFNWNKSIRKKWSTYYIIILIIIYVNECENLFVFLPTLSKPPHRRLESLYSLSSSLRIENIVLKQFNAYERIDITNFHLFVNNFCFFFSSDFARKIIVVKRLSSIKISQKDNDESEPMT